jgi:hypothetical protein
MIQLEVGFLQMTDWSKWLVIESLMISHYAGIQRGSQFMILLISLGGVQQT